MTARRKEAVTAGLSRRRLLLTGAAGLAATALRCPTPALAQSKPFSGITLRCAAYQHEFMVILQGYIPEFEQQTGMKVELRLFPFQNYNPLVTSALSADAEALDVINVTFFLAAKWIATGLLTNLDEFTLDRSVTPADWDPGDFVNGAQLPYQDAKGATYGYAWEGGAMVMGLSRMDLMQRKGLKPPRTFDELLHVSTELNGVDGINGYVGWQLHHWNLIPYLQGFGGNVFRNPPDDTTPTLNSDAAVKAVKFYAQLLACAPADVLSYTEARARQTALAGRANIFIHSSSWITPMLFSDQSKVKDTALIMPMPAGPVRNCPASNSQGLGIPRNAKNKPAAWEFIKWALGPELLMRIVKEHRYMSLCRRSVIESEAYREIGTVRGQDFGALYLKVLELPAKSGYNYMAYRTVPEFSLVGEFINQAVDDVVRQKRSVQAAMDIAQQNALAALGTARNVR
jgi:multiple sugar transport system substrate-binding protein